MTGAYRIEAPQGQTASIRNKRSEETTRFSELQTDTQLVGACTPFTGNWFLYQLKGNTRVCRELNK